MSFSVFVVHIMVVHRVLIKAEAEIRESDTPPPPFAIKNCSAEMNSIVD